MRASLAAAALLSVAQYAAAQTFTSCNPLDTSASLLLLLIAPLPPLSLAEWLQLTPPSLPF